jgi:hypothetical protein
MTEKKLNFAERVKARQAKEQASVDAAEARREKMDETARTVEVRWAQAYKELYAAMVDVNRVFAENGEPYRLFRIQPQPQPGAENFTCLMVYYTDTRKTVSAVSETSIIVGLNGVVEVRHPSVQRTFGVSHVDKEQWEELFGDIHDQDTGA